MVLLHVSDYSIVCADQTSLLITYLDVVTMTNGSEVSKYLLSIPILNSSWTGDQQFALMLATQRVDCALPQLGLNFLICKEGTVILFNSEGCCGNSVR